MFPVKISLSVSEIIPVIYRPIIKPPPPLCLEKPCFCHKSRRFIWILIKWGFRKHQRRWKCWEEQEGGSTFWHLQRRVPPPQPWSWPMTGFPPVLENLENGKNFSSQGKQEFWLFSGKVVKIWKYYQEKLLKIETWREKGQRLLGFNHSNKKWQVLFLVYFLTWCKLKFLKRGG